MEVVVERRGGLTALAIFGGVTFLALAALEVSAIWIQYPAFFTSGGNIVIGEVNEGTGFWLDHLLKSFVVGLVAGLFLYACPRLKTGTLEGYSFLVGAGVMALGLGVIFTLSWLGEGLSALLENEGWNILNAFRLEIPLGIGIGIAVLGIWKNQPRYISK
ncbi:MAG: hypothetical protein ACTSU5_01585 [Promethearchaeota archaeon]